LKQQGIRGGQANGLGKSKVHGLLSLHVQEPSQVPAPSHWSFFVHEKLSLQGVPAAGQVTVQLAVPLHVRFAPQVPGSLVQSTVVPRQPPFASHASP
jgi:hypothetical protein